MRLRNRRFIRAINWWKIVLRNETGSTHLLIELAGFAYRSVHRIKGCGLIAVCWTKTKALTQILNFWIQKFLSYVWSDERLCPCLGSFLCVFSAARVRFLRDTEGRNTWFQGRRIFGFGFLPQRVGAFRSIEVESEKGN